VFAFTGKGNVTKDALEIFQLLPHKMITLEEAKEIKNKSGPHKCLHGLIVDQDHIVKKSERQEGAFDVEHYRANPSEYESIFSKTLTPVCNVIVNGIYWDERYPCLLTKEEMLDQYKQGNRRYANTMTSQQN
jgi:alpha-aminoadipic semialdehyde synthase